MYLVEVFFRCSVVQESQITLLNQIIDQWRYNGQIIGREIPLYFAQQERQSGFAVRVICPEQHSLLEQWNNKPVQQALERAKQAGVILDSLQIIADDLNSDSTYSESKPEWLVLYTTHLQSCSPIHNGTDLQPIPLYKFFQKTPHLSLDLIKWQENWQAYDQLQMNGAGLEKLALAEISEPNSRLSKHGIALAKEVEQSIGIPTYYYLYRVGGESLAKEQQRSCPCCKEKWRLEAPMGILYFKCDRCRLVSNLSWNF